MARVEAAERALYRGPLSSLPGECSRGGTRLRSPWVERDAKSVYAVYTPFKQENTDGYRDC